MSIFPEPRLLGLVASLLAVLTEPGAAAPAQPRETVNARGILAGSSLVLFAEVRSCSAEQTLPSLQIFVSTDQGRTWSKRGPALEGSSAEYAGVAGEGVWVVGLRTAEGPGVDPFLLVPTDAPAAWTVRPIFEGPAQVSAAARVAKGHDGAVLVWLRHLDVHHDARGPLFLHRSDDAGATWKTTGPLGSATPPTPARRFSRLSNSSAGYRIVDRPDGGFDVRRRKGSSWETAAEFPWTACPP